MLKENKQKKYLPEHFWIVDERDVVTLFEIRRD